MFTYNFQLAGYPYEKYDEKGHTDVPNFLKVVHSFPWIEQLNEYIRLREGCSATVAVTDTESGNALWISIAGEEKKPTFLIGYVYPKEFRNWRRLGKKDIRRWVDIYILEELSSANEIVEAFFKKDLDLVGELLSKKEIFDRMPAMNK